MPKLDVVEENMNHNDLVFKWLLEEKISYTDLSKRYVAVLEHNKRESTTEKSCYSNLLAQYLQYAKLDTQYKWVEDKTVGTLVCYERFKGAPVFKKWEEIIKERKINTDKNNIEFVVYMEE